MREKTAEKLEKKAKLCEEIIDRYLPTPKGYYAVLTDAMRYSVNAGGKRVRPVIMMETCKIFGGAPSAILEPFVAAMEMIHTYSLIHDDLPAMDNDDLRRGRPTCHKAFGESFAILAGDMLLNTAHEVLLKLALKGESYAKASLNMSQLAGISGMIGGQSIDLESEGKKISVDVLYSLQKKKTGALIEAAVTTPFFLSDAPSTVYDLLKDYSYHLGLAFQIKDDILDVEADQEKLGKSTGKDERDDKSTFVTLLGLDEAKLKLNEEENACNAVLDTLRKDGFNVELLEELTVFNLKRDY